jgi:hypothetical protein
MKHQGQADKNPVLYSTYRKEEASKSKGTFFLKDSFIGIVLGGPFEPSRT